MYLLYRIYWYLFGTFRSINCLGIIHTCPLLRMVSNVCCAQYNFTEKMNKWVRYLEIICSQVLKYIESLVSSFSLEICSEDFILRETPGSGAQRSWRQLSHSSLVKHAASPELLTATDLVTWILLRMWIFSQLSPVCPSVCFYLLYIFLKGCQCSCWWHSSWVNLISHLDSEMLLDDFDLCV